MTDYLTDLERQLELAEAKLTELEAELVAWRSGSKSLAATKIEEHFAESTR